MNIYLKEKIGNPDLFTGRRKELHDLLIWVNKIKKELSPSRALLSRRKTGKTALLQRLYNMVFNANDGVIPFYYEVQEEKQWSVEFCEDFFVKFILQYIAFKSRKAEYLNIRKIPYETLIHIVEKESQPHLIDWITAFQSLVREEKISQLWQTARDAPRLIATIHNERVLQIIDEFQYLNRKVYRDKDCANLIHDFAQSYMVTAEYKNAPLIISGSWVGLLMHDVLKMPGRFQITTLEMMPPTEAVEMVYKYCLIEEIPVTDETAHLIADIAEGNPFYISALIRSVYPQKNLTTKQGVLNTLEFETLDKRGNIKGTWMEYILYAFSTVNEIHAKNVVLYLCKNRDREVSRQEILETLKLEMTDAELEKKLNALVKSDIIEEGRSSYYVRGVQDNIFDKVFRGRYADAITNFHPQEITNEYKVLYENLLAKYQKTVGRQSHYKGMYAEFMMITHLMYHAYQNNQKYLAMMHNLPQDFVFTEFRHVWSYKSAPIYQPDIQVDIFARANPGAYAMIGEVKNRDKVKFSPEEAAAFKEKADIIIRSEQLERVVLFVFSRAGFTEEALKFCKQHQIAWTEDVGWLDHGEG